MGLKRVKLVVAYDGTNYCGWQIQPNGETIESVLNRHLSALLKEEIVVTGASRTDSGVHSLGNVAIFDTTSRMPADKISFALNQKLPADIVVQDSCEVPADWHPRFQKGRKTYEYRILNRTFRDPTRRLDTHFYYHALDVEKMQEAATGQTQGSQPTVNRSASTASLKNYTSSTMNKNNSQGTKYREGSLAAKANAMQRYMDNNGGK